MNKIPIRLFSLSIAIILLFLCSGCSFINQILAPDNYKTGYEINNDFPLHIVPLFDDDIVFEYEEDDGSYYMKTGSTHDVEDIADFYIEFFEDEKITLTVQKDRRNQYIAEGAKDKFEFEIVTEKPSGKWEEKLYQTVTEIKVQLLNIPDKKALHDYITKVKGDLNTLSDILAENEKLENIELSEDLCSTISEMTDTISTKLSEIKRRQVPELIEFEKLHASDIALFELSEEVFKEYEDITEYGINLFEIMQLITTTSSNDLTDIYIEMYEIYSNIIYKLQAITPPSFLNNMHNTIIDIFVHTTDVVDYSLFALEINDPLRLNAGLYMLEMAAQDMDKMVEKIDQDSLARETKIDKDTQFIINVIKGLTEWLDKITIEINEDAAEISKLPQNLDISQKDTEISCNYIVPDVIIPANYSSLQNIVFLQCWTNKGTANAKITVEIPGLTQKYEQKVELSRAEMEFNILPPLLENAIDSLNSSKQAQIVISVEDLSSGKLIVQDSIDVLIYSRFDMQWHSKDGTPCLENILAWLTPETTEVKQLLRYSADSANYLTDGTLDSIVGYQYISDWNEITGTYVQVCSMMHAMADTMQVKYIATPFSTTASHLQRVATPQEVLNNASGVCVETAVTIASAIQATGMHPVLIILPGHVQVAVESWFDSGEYLLIETTALSEAATENFDDVILYLTPNEWDEYISQDGFTIIDCNFPN